MATKKKPAVWLIRKLKPHPRQANTFPDLSDVDLAVLAADMKANGLQHPIEVLPDGTILGGHQRLRAAKLLGWKEIDVIVRYDLADNEAAATAYFITDNLNRRQLSPLRKAQSVSDLIELEAGRKARDMYWEDRDGLKAEVAKRLGVSLRTVNRYLLALKAPQSVQLAFERSHLNLIQTGRIACLSNTEAEAIGDAVAKVYARHREKGVSDSTIAKEVRAAALGANVKDSETVKTSLYRIVRSLRRGLPSVRDGLDDIKPESLTKLRELMAEAQSVFAALKKRAG